VRAAQPATRPSRTGSRASQQAGGRVQVSAILAVLGLALAAILTAAFLLGSPGGGPPTNAGNPVMPTSNPSVLATPPPAEQVAIRGTILVVKAGRLWAISGTDPPRRLAGSENLASPAWSPDGRYIYAIKQQRTRALSPYHGKDEPYTLVYPQIVRMDAQGSGERVVQNGLYTLGGSSSRLWFSWLLQPDVSPDGRRFALVSDAPQPFQRDPTLSLLPIGGGRVTNLNLPEQAPLGHSDPDWSPDGTQIAFTRNLGERGSGEPRIALYNVRTRAFRDLSKRGYAQASWSPDGRYLAAVVTDGHGRDVVILDARNGAEIARLTRDGESFAPTWSSDGTQIAYLNVDDQGVDLRLLTLASGAGFRAESDKAVTEDGQLDATSQPAWFVPPAVGG
jgi:Tol biopolymer transport system component